MNRPENLPREASAGLVRSPWPAIGVGVAAAVLALLCRSVEALTPLRVGLIVAALIAAGAAVRIRLRGPWQEWDERVRAAGVVFVAAFVALLAHEGLDTKWDTARLLVKVLAVAAGAGALLVMLPSLARRVVLTFLVLFHFVGILTAVTSVAFPGSPSPWTTIQLWTRVYRPYLQFMYLNNAYHFYSPEPGPATLLWFRVEYADKSSRWVTVPDRKAVATQLEYQRRLALTESANVILPQSTQPMDDLIYSRQVAGELHRPKIPLRPEIPMALQYREPSPYSKNMTASYARHVARSYPHPEAPETPVESVKVYRVVHSILPASEYGQGSHWLDPVWYLPYFQGEFDRDGNMKKPKDVAEGKSDPFLYWLMPIIRVPKEGQRPILQGMQRPDPKDMELLNYLEIHAGDLPPLHEDAQR